MGTEFCSGQFLRSRASRPCQLKGLERESEYRGGGRVEGPGENEKHAGATLCRRERLSTHRAIERIPIRLWSEYPGPKTSLLPAGDTSFFGRLQPIKCRRDRAAS